MRNNTRNGNRSKYKSNKNKDNAQIHSREASASSPNSGCDKPVTDDSKAFNDPDWYVNSEQILKDVARIPYSIPVGTCYKREGTFSVDPMYVPSAYDNAVPGIMVSYLMPTLGATEQSQSSGVNIAANSLFQFIRSKISGSRKYEAVDTMIYLGCMDSIFTNITWATRLYATAYTYHQSNKYLSRALVEAQNVDFDSIVNNLPNFRSALNIEIAKIRAMYLPSVLPIFKRHSWMFSHYFIEGDSEKDQIYMHAPAGYYVFGLDASGKGMMESKTLMGSSPLTWTDIVTIIRNQINAIFEREDFNTISGDMLKAYEGNVFTLTEIPDIATVNLTNSPEVLLQFKNAKYKNIPVETNDPTKWYASFFNYIQNNTGDLLMLGDSTLWGTVAIEHVMFVRSNDNVLTNPSNNNHILRMKACLNEWTKDTLLTTPTHDVQPVENMINTRLTLGLALREDASAVNGVLYTEAYYGSEWPVCYKLFAYHKAKATGNISLFSRTYDRTLNMVKSDCELWVASQEPIRSAFKYLPELSLIVFDVDQNGDVVVINEPGRSIFEVDNYALINTQTLNGLHTAAILGEYDIPNLSIGR